MQKKITDEDKIEMNILYKTNTLQQLADKYKVNVTTVYRYIKNTRQSGVAKGKRIKVTEVMEQQFKDLYKQNKSVCSIAKMFDVSHTTVDRYLNRGWVDEVIS